MSKLRTLVFLTLLYCCSALCAQTRTDPAPIPLSLRKAVEIALSPNGNATAQLAMESASVARAQGKEVRAALLPTVSGYVREQRQVVSVDALGIQIQTPIPVQLGNASYSTFDARVVAEQTMFNWSAVRQLQAAHAAVRSSDAGLKQAQEDVVKRVASSYLSALRSSALVQAAQSDVTLAESLATLADHRMSAGKAVALEVTRARSQVAHAHLRLLSAENDDVRARMQVCKDLGLPLDTAFVLTDTLAFNRSEDPSVPETLKTAQDARHDVRAQEQRVRQAELLHGSARADSLPSIYGYADYGPLGLTPGQTIDTYTVGIGLRIPIFDGGRREARRAETQSLYRQEQIKAKDMRAQVELEVRESLENLRLTAAQVEAAEQGSALAEEELAQAQRRYDAGLSSSLDVIEGQNRLERAREERVTALYAYNLAVVEMGHATGDIRRIIR